MAKQEKRETVVTPHNIRLLFGPQIYCTKAVANLQEKIEALARGERIERSKEKGRGK